MPPTREGKDSSEIVSGGVPRGLDFAVSRIRPLP